MAVLGSVVNGELTVRLAQRLNHLCLISSHGHCILPAVKFKGLIITAVTTGTISAQAKSLASNKALVQAVNRVTQAAYGAFTHGLDLSLGIAAGLMAVSAIVAFGLVRWPRTAAGEPAPDTEEAASRTSLR